MSHSSSEYCKTHRTVLFCFEFLCSNLVFRLSVLCVFALLSLLARNEHASANETTDSATTIELHAQQSRFQNSSLPLLEPSSDLFPHLLFSGILLVKVGRASRFVLSRDVSKCREIVADRFLFAFLVSSRSRGVVPSDSSRSRYREVGAEGGGKRAERDEPFVDEGLLANVLEGRSSYDAKLS